MIGPSLADVEVAHDRLEAALVGLRRYGGPVAIRACEHLEVAVQHAATRGTRWAEQMCYCLREGLESIPLLFGQQRVQSMGSTAQRFAEDMSDAVAVNHSPEVLQRIIARHKGELDEGERSRRHRIAQAMMTQAGAGMGTSYTDAFAVKWASTVDRVNHILHEGDNDDGEALDLLARAVDLIAALVGPMSTRLEEMDRFAALVSPGTDDVRRVLELVADERLARYFFSKAESPAWLETLEDKGVFDLPMQGDWYQGGLLIRVSARAPALARAITKRIVGDPHPAVTIVVLGVGRELVVR